MSGRLKTKPAGENAGRGPRIDCRTVSTITGHECGISTLLDEYSCEYSLSLSKWCAFLHSDGWPGRHRFGKHSLTVPVRPVYPYTHPTVPNRGVSCLAGGGLGGLLVRVGGHDGLLGVRDGGGGGVGLRLRLLHGGAVGLVLAHGGLELLQELRAGLGRDGVLGEPAEEAQVAPDQPGQVLLVQLALAGGVEARDHPAEDHLGRLAAQAHGAAGVEAAQQQGVGVLLADVLGPGVLAVLAVGVLELLEEALELLVAHLGVPDAAGQLDLLGHHAHLHHADGGVDAAGREGEQLAVLLVVEAEPVRIGRDGDAELVLRGRERPATLRAVAPVVLRGAAAGRDGDGVAVGHGQSPSRRLSRCSSHGLGCGCSSGPSVSSRYLRLAGEGVVLGWENSSTKDECR